MSEKDKKVKFDIDNGREFFADEAGVIHNPLKIILDFRSITPRIDVRNQEFVIMDPFTEKTFSDLLKKNLDNYEKQFGKIKRPEQLKKSEKKGKKKTKGKSKAPTYFG